MPSRNRATKQELIDKCIYLTADTTIGCTSDKTIGTDIVSTVIGRTSRPESFRAEAVSWAVNSTADKSASACTRPDIPCTSGTRPFVRLLLARSATSGGGRCRRRRSWRLVVPRGADGLISGTTDEAIAPIKAT